MLFGVVAGLILLFLYFTYYFYFGPSKLERDIKKEGGLHPCLYCKKEIHINDKNCKYCEKINYSGMRSNRLKQFYIILVLAIFALIKLYERMSGGY